MIKYITGSHTQGTAWLSCVANSVLLSIQATPLQVPIMSSTLLLLILLLILQNDIGCFLPTVPFWCPHRTNASQSSKWTQTDIENDNVQKLVGEHFNLFHHSIAVFMTIHQNNNIGATKQSKELNRVYSSSWHHHRRRPDSWLKLLSTSQSSLKEHCFKSGVDKPQPFICQSVVVPQFPVSL